MTFPIWFLVVSHASAFVCGGAVTLGAVCWLAGREDEARVRAMRGARL
jgi:hypothetical protein